MIKRISAIVAFISVLAGSVSAGIRIKTVDMENRGTGGSVVSVEVECANAAPELFILEYRSSLLASNWVPVATNDLQSPGGWLIHSDPLMASSGFYRITSGNDIVEFSIGVVFEDSFDGTSNTPLAGTLPNMAPDGAVWKGNAEWSLTGDGTVETPTSEKYSAYLDFVPEPGNIYTLTVSAHVYSAANWRTPFAIGFISEGNTGSSINWWQNSSNSPWIRIQPEPFTLGVSGYPRGVVSGMQGVRDAVAGSASFPNVSDGFNDYQIVLNTALPSWTATFFFNGDPIGVHAYTSSIPNIAGIGFGMSALGTNNSPAAIGSFELSVVPQASEVLLVGDDFSGNGSVVSSALECDIRRQGWESSAPLQLENGKLTAGASWQYASIRLPPVSPYGILKITADYTSDNNNFWLGMGFGGSPGFLHNSTNSGPWFNVRGNGVVNLFGGRGTSNRVSAVVAPPAQCEIMMEYNVFTETATLSVGNVTVFDDIPVTNSFVMVPNPYWAITNYYSPVVTPFVPTMIPSPQEMNYFTIAFETDTETAGHSLDNIRVEYLPRPRPLRVLDTIQTIDVTDTSVSGIQQALVDARALSNAQNPVRVNIPRGTYYFYAPTNNIQCVFEINSLDYTVVDWNGSEVFLQNPARGFMKLFASRYVIVKNVEVDYSVLPFTQGTVVAVDSNNRTVDVEIDGDFAYPTNAYFTTGKYEDDRRWGHLVDPDIPGRHKEDSALHYWFTNVAQVSGRTFRYSMEEDPAADFEIGDRFADLPRFSRSMFELGASRQLTLDNVTAYSCGAFFATGWFLEQCNFLNVKVLLKSGRLKSINGDCITGTCWEPGAWVENCLFEGTGDDISHQKSATGTYYSGNVMKNSRRFGVFLQGTSHAVIRNNCFEGLSGENVAGYMEDTTRDFGGRDVLILGNTLIDFSPQWAFQAGGRHFAGISARYEYSNESAGIYNSGWWIVDNFFLDWKRTAISIGNAELVGIYDNAFSAPVADSDVAETNEILIYESTNVVVE